MVVVKILLDGKGGGGVTIGWRGATGFGAGEREGGTNPKGIFAAIWGMMQALLGSPVRPSAAVAVTLR